VKDELPEAVKAIAQSYRREGKVIHHMDTVDLPSKEVIIRILNDLIEVLFPGYFGKKGLRLETIHHNVYTVLERVYPDLSAQIYLSLRHSCKKIVGENGDYECPGDQLKTSPDCSMCENTAKEVCLKLFRKIPEIRRILSGDVKAAYDGDPAATGYPEIIFSYPCIYAIAVYRIAHELHKTGVKLIPRIMTEHSHSVTGIDIHPGAEIGEGFFIDHATGVVIGETTIIGKNVRIYHGVTLGAYNFPRDKNGNLIRGQKRHPTIEDDVIIYSGATILGGNTVIGKGSIIGGNVWLTSSVPAGSMVMMPQPDLKIQSRRPASKKSAT